MIAMTAKQRDELNEIGWTVLESVLTPEETERLSDAWDDVADQLRRKQGLGPNDSVGSRNGLRLNDTILDLIDHPKILPLVVDAIGWNIQNRDSTFGCQAPKPSDSDPDVLSLGWHFDYEEEFAGTTIDGRMPLIDFKVGWYISDHTEPGHATILLVPGSYKWTREQRATWESWADPKDIFELRVPAGSALLWRPTTLHAVTPNLSKSFRKASYVSYTPRWVRPSCYLEQDPELLARSSPIRRQLLGAMGDLSHPLGKDPVGAPSSQHWFSLDGWQTVPLKAWAEAQAGEGEHVWGLGYGATYTKGPKHEFTQIRVPKKIDV